MSTASTLLGLLEAGPSHGYSLKQRYDEHFSRKRQLAFGQVYATLGRFEKAGLAESLDVEAGSGPDRRRYRITPAGVTSLDHWVFSPQDPDLFATSDLYARVTVALLSGRDAVDVLDTQRASHLAHMRELQSARRTAGGSELLGLTYELSHLDADLRWIEESIARLPQITRELAAEHGPEHGSERSDAHG